MRNMNVPQRIFRQISWPTASCALLPCFPRRESWSPRPALSLAWGASGLPSLRSTMSTSSGWM